MPRKIGILGGTFDPVHAGHVALARAAVRELGLDALYLVPAKRSPMKGGRPAAGAARRLEMLRLAAREVPRCRVSRAELDRSGPSYTAGTVRAFRRKFPRARLHLIVGSDCLAGFPRWKDSGAILREARLVAGRRAGGRKKVPALLAGRVEFLRSGMPRISSTRIRAGVRRAGTGEAVPETVRRYILKHGLYRRPYPEG
ncbi:MAG: nicotinate (nicotinamide) nucleotide adenylyltransferase [Elusimicrobia bacterium RIFCSPHIGHO2_01_FULL_64_10]|nr:MAG: nicotinate (nicotinamide) nucleotide adenylyltransferase [Elusimicrobia bacterium RIFCSPHIGHO2_01_FULL_64_10]